MTLKCSTCQKVFTTKYHYEKHINKITPCGTVFICDKCGKKFETQRSYDSHMSRKTPCVKTIVKVAFNKILLAKEKTLQRKESVKLEKIKLESKLKLEELKIANKILLENEKAKIKLDLKNKELELKNKDLELLESKNRIKSELKNKDLELLESKNKTKIELKDKDIEIKNNYNNTQLELSDKKFLIEKEKKLNKLLTPDVIKEIEYKKNTEIFIQYMNDVYLSEDSNYVGNLYNLSYWSDILLDNMDIKNEYDVKYKSKIIREFYKLYESSKNTVDYIQIVIEKIYKNPNDIENRCLFYNEIIDDYYGTYKIDGKRVLKKVDFTADIMPLFKETLIKLTDILVKCTRVKCNMELLEFQKYLKLECDITKMLKLYEDEYREYCKDVFIIDKFKLCIEDVKVEEVIIKPKLLTFREEMLLEDPSYFDKQDDLDSWG